MSTSNQPFSATPISSSTLPPPPSSSSPSSSSSSAPSSSHSSSLPPSPRYIPLPPTNPQTTVDIYVYFDKLYTSVTIFFLIAIIIMILYSSPYIPVVVALYFVIMLAIYFYRNPLFAKTSDEKPSPPSLPKSSSSSSSILPEVFHIPGNEYTYEDAKAVCKAYDARLATYAEIEQAYQNGADWCSYGWSEQQNAFFPTQQKHFDILQKIEGHEHDCGRVGVNGGYIANPNIRFGVNCYGKKPAITPNEEQYMAAYSPYPLTKQDIEMDKKISYLKNNLQNILISPFSPNEWNSPTLKI